MQAGARPSAPTSSSARLRLSDARLQDTLISGPDGRSPNRQGNQRPKAPTSAPTAGSPSPAQAGRVIATRRPNSVPHGSQLAPVPGEQAASAATRAGAAIGAAALDDGEGEVEEEILDEALADDDVLALVARSRREDAADTASNAGSRAAASTARAPSAAPSATSTALRSAAVLALERALGRDLELRVKSGVRPLPAELSKFDPAVAESNAAVDAAVAGSGEDGAIPLMHVVLTCDDVRSIKDSETLRFLQENSKAFLRYVGDGSGGKKPPPGPSPKPEAAATDDPEEKTVALGASATRPASGSVHRSASRQGMRDSLSGSLKGIERQPSEDNKEDINELARRLCDEIATFITTVDDHGDEFVIATDKATGEVLVPVELDDAIGGGGGGDIAVIDDLADMEHGDSDEDEAPAERSGSDSDGDDALQEDPAGDTDDDDDDDLTDGKQASAFAEALVKMRKNVEANSRAQKIAANSQPSGPAGNPPSSEAPGSKAVTPPRPPSGASTTASVRFDSAAPEVKLFTPSVGPAPNRRVEALMKMTSKDARPRYMRGTSNRTGTTAADEEAKAAKAAKAQAEQHRLQAQATGTQKPRKGKGAAAAASAAESPKVKSSYAAAQQMSVQGSAIDATGSQITDGAAAADGPPVVKPQRKTLSVRQERRVDWLIDCGDDWEAAAPAPVCAAGEDDDPSVYDSNSVHCQPASAGYQLPARAAEIDKLLAAFAGTRGTHDLPSVDVAGAIAMADGFGAEEVYSITPTASLTAGGIAAAAADEVVEELEAEGDGAGTPRKSQTVKSAAAKASPTKGKPKPATTAAVPKPVTAEAEAALKAEQRRKALGGAYIEEQRETRVARQQMARINDRLRNLGAEVDALYQGKFGAERSMVRHNDPTAIVWPAAEAGNVVRPPSPDAIERLIEEARREQFRAKWDPSPAAAEGTAAAAAAAVTATDPAPPSQGEPVAAEL